ncbi:MAG: DinB family protein [Rhodothermales bacterium]
MIDELSDYWEHFERYRAVTLQMLDQVEEPDLDWRPLPEMMNLGQQFVHIAQAEDLMIRGLFEDDWDLDRARLPKHVRDIDKLRMSFEDAHARARGKLDGLDVRGLFETFGEPPSTRASRLWALLEHEVHHAAQISLYLRLLGKVPPYFGEPLEPGSRPDVALRAQYGGV